MLLFLTVSSSIMHIFFTALTFIARISLHYHCLCFSFLLVIHIYEHISHNFGISSLFLPLLVQNHGFALANAYLLLVNILNLLHLFCTRIFHCNTFLIHTFLLKILSLFEHKFQCFRTHTIMPFIVHNFLIVPLGLIHTFYMALFFLMTFTFLNFYYLQSFFLRLCIYLTVCHILNTHSCLGFACVICLCMYFNLFFR